MNNPPYSLALFLASSSFVPKSSPRFFSFGSPPALALSRKASTPKGSAVSRSKATGLRAGIG
jgi:hypothetical protein